jgi:hypothetical protein
MAQTGFTLSGHVRGLFRWIWTLPKIIAMALTVGALIVLGLALDSVTYILKDKAEGYATTWAGGLVQEPRTRSAVVWLTSTAIQYPTATVIAAFLILVLIIVIISAYQAVRFGLPPSPSKPEPVSAVDSALGRAFPNVVIQNANVVNIIQRGPADYEATVRVHTQTVVLPLIEDPVFSAQATVIPPDTALPKIEEVVNQTFRTQEVLLDGHAYFACTFEDCRFVYNFGATGGFGPHCTFAGLRGIQGSDPRLQHLLHFLESLGLLNPFLKPFYTPKSAALISTTSIQEEVQREIHMVMNNRDHPYWDAKRAGHTEAVERMRKLYQIAYPDKPLPTRE